MPDIGFVATPLRDARRLQQSLAEIADHGFAELMRRDAAVRVLVLARRLPAPTAETPAVTLVRRLASAWDPSVMTAGEYAESLSVAELDGLLVAARAWAAAAAETAPEMQRAA
jgi:hypothetical protein